MMLEIASVACARGAVQVLQDVSLTVTAGEAVVLRGPNGAGKTTLLRVIAGLAQPLSGRVICAEDSIAYSGHSDGIKTNLTVAQNLGFWAGVFGQRDITPALDAFDLHDLRDRAAGEMSAGQKRRLSLARLLVTGRPIWCLDEPTVSLDQENVARFAAAVEAHLARGGAALIATHIDLGLSGARVFDLKAHMCKRLAQGDPFSDQDFSADWGKP
ncbi:heme ABC exporter ATP-binding protein CcmA [Rhodobacteraceae bacterium XHP0102]|nr:heme ABC exporter ATP-binding protein CcmA [Rhodobacteraceae bacterium XHP0102]